MDIICKRCNEKMKQYRGFVACPKCYCTVNDYILMDLMKIIDGHIKSVDSDCEEVNLTGRTFIVDEYRFYIEEHRGNYYKLIFTKGAK